MALTDYQTKVTDMVRDDESKITVDQRDAAIADAVIQFSGDRPHVLVEDIPGTGSNYLDLPENWDSEFSKVKTLEYPIGNVPPTLIASSEWQMYQSPSGERIMLLNSVQVAAYVRLSYLVMHTLDETTDTIPLNDRMAVSALAASYLCDQLANTYAGSTDSSIQADAVNHIGKSAEFAARARALRKQYMDHIGINDKRPQPAGVVVRMERNDSRGRPRLTH